jgi:predicted nuclease with TOPRIM domain
VSTVEPARHALYSRLEEVLGRDHAETLMTHLPQHRADEVATKGDLEDLKSWIDRRFDSFEERFDRIDERFARMDEGFDRMDARFDRMDDRFDRMDERFDRSQRFYVGVTFATLTAMTAIFSVVVSLLV